MPEIDAVARDAAPAGLAFLAMSYREDVVIVRSYLENTRYRFAVGVDATGELAGAFGVATLPAHIFIGRDGLVTAVRIGGMTRAEMELEVGRITGTQVAGA